MSKIRKLLDLMHEYQRINKINGECVTNVQYLYDTINFNYPNLEYKPKVKAVICFYQDLKKHTNVINIHMVIMMNNKNLIDPSYEINSLENVLYFDSIKEFIDVIGKEFMKTISIKDFIEKFLHFKDIEETINNGDCLIVNKKYYNNQADHIENHFRKLHFK